MPVDLTHSPDATLRTMYSMYRQQLASYLKAERPYWAQKLGIQSGTLTNLEQGLAWLATAGHSGLGAGCVELQDRTFQVLHPIRGGYEVVRWRIGSDTVGHSAVLVHRTGQSERSGYVFDPWIVQTPLVYEYAEWERAMRLARTLGRGRRQ